MMIDKESIEPDVAAGWRDPAVRAEFNGDRDCYAAYLLAVARGQARVYGQAAGRTTDQANAAVSEASAQHNVEFDSIKGEHFVRSKQGLRMAYDPAWPADRREQALRLASR
jgi:hypothetical protein